jgi:putative serine protease PepD
VADVNDAKHSRGGRRWLPWAALGGALVVGGGIGAGIVAATSSSTPAAASTTTGAASSGSGQVSACDVTSVANQVIPSVVTISARGTGGGGTGSGEIIKSDGYIVTNNHVIAIAANGGSVEVQFADGQTAPATIVGRDPLTDLAVLKVDTSAKLQPIAIGSSSSVVVGQAAVVIGAPLGLSGTVTSGIVSALDRTIEVPGENDSSALLVGALQTDASINPGNSGGSMVNCSGQLIGIPTAGASVPSSSGESNGGSIGLGFAIPVNLAMTIADEIIATGSVTHAYFGLNAAPIPPSAAAQAGVPEGLFVQSVAPGGPAARAGLRQGDVITKIDGAPATSTVQLQELTLTKKPGDTVPLEYWRDGTSATVTVTLGTQP